MKNKVHSFDLVAHNEHITACNIAKVSAAAVTPPSNGRSLFTFAQVPLKHGTLDVAIFCLSLMGTDFMKFLKEAHRTLKPGSALPLWLSWLISISVCSLASGLLKIAEVQSRFEGANMVAGLDAFIKAVCELGFNHLHTVRIRPVKWLKISNAMPRSAGWTQQDVRAA